MSHAIPSSFGIAAYLAMFVGIGVIFVFVNLLIGRFLRPNNPHAEKLEIYECGEPAIGSSFVQFDLRFYVIALLFIIFDVEVAFFFPWATLFGKSVNLSSEQPGNVAVVRTGDDLDLTPNARALFMELGVRQPEVPSSVPASLEGEIDALDERQKSEQIVHRGARQLAVLSSLDIIAFFAVLMIGFAYVWKRGDLDWVRVTQSATAPEVGAPPEGSAEAQPIRLA